MKKYFIDLEEVSEEEFNEELENEIEHYIEESYDDVLDDMYPPYQVGCCTFYASNVLRQLDPVAYHCGFDDFVDSELSDKKYELETQSYCEVNGTIFEIKEDEEDE